MICKNCQKNVATVHLTDILEEETPGERPQVEERHLCEICAQALHLPHASPQPKSMADIWKLLHKSAQKARKRRPTLSCKECETTLEELRQRGRLGCATCYEVFAGYLDELLERMHGAREHCGRLPGLAQASVERREEIRGLNRELEQAIDAEAYELAAGIRDKLKGLQAGPSASETETL
ncbi:MAG: protein arginine kinase activator [Chlamydiales bacterium]|jgi:protein arginine kinase activator